MHTGYTKILMVIDIHEPFSLAQLKAWNDADHFFNNFKVRLDVGGQSLESAAKQPRDRDGDRKLGRERGRETSNLKFVDTGTS